MHKALSIALFACFAGSHAQCAPLERDERDVLRSANVYHIMAASKEPLEKIRAQLRGVPADHLLDEFKQRAKRESSDPGSAPSGGDLGLVVEGTMDEKFDAAVFSQRPMQVSTPQQSKFGWHLILVTSEKQEPIRAICERSLVAAQRAVPISPAGIYRLSLEKQTFESLHPAVRQYLEGGWGPPMNWNDNLSYIRTEPEPSTSGMVKFFVHTEIPFARYYASPIACRRSARDVFQVNCVASTVALISHIEYEGRAATGRRLIEVEYGPAKRTIESAKSGPLTQIAEMACSASRR